MQGVSFQAQTPLQELLRSVPIDFRNIFELGDYHSMHIPIGKHCHDAATLIDDLRDYLQISNEFVRLLLTDQEGDLSEIVRFKLEHNCTIKEAATRFLANMKSLTAAQTIMKPTIEE